MLSARLQRGEAAIRRYDFSRFNAFSKLQDELERTKSALEDRKVKQRFRGLAQEGRAAILTKHPLTPTEQETGLNPASRSAKLRALEMR